MTTLDVVLLLAIEDDIDVTDTPGRILPKHHN
jgi:hypothetical protein